MDSPSEQSAVRNPGTDLLPLLRIATLAGRGDEPGPALSVILDVCMETFRASSGSISLLNPDTGLLEIEVMRGLPEEARQVSLRPGQGITGWVAFHGRPRLVADIAAEPRTIRIRQEARSEMAVPMLESGGQCIGVINLDSETPGHFSAADLDLATTLAQEATAVMGRLWQLHHLRDKARQLESLIRIGQSLVTKLEPQELFDSITRDARQIAQARACGLYLFDAAGRTLRCASLAGEESIPAPAGEAPLDNTLAGVVVQTRKQAEFTNIATPDYADLADIPSDPSLRSVLASPLLFENEPIGVLTVFTANIHRFNNDERRLCAALASLAAVTVQNARLYTRVFQSEASLRKNEQLTTLGLLAAEIAHEIRNPLTVIKLLYGTLGLDFPEGDPRRTDVRLIGEKLDQLEAIVSRVLNFAKAPASLHSRWPVTTIIEETLLLIRLKLAQNKIHLVYHPPPHPIVVDANKGQIQQVLLNVLINATQAMPEGGSIAVTLSSDESGPGPTASIEIADTGQGIPGPIRAQIFDSFLSGRPDGTGLGLAIAKRILLGHHGDIALVSSGPGGTTMRITLPLARG